MTNREAKTMRPTLTDTIRFKVTGLTTGVVELTYQSLFYPLERPQASRLFNSLLEQNGFTSWAYMLADKWAIAQRIAARPQHQPAIYAMF